MSSAEPNFFDLYAHGFVRVAVAVPRVALADPTTNGATLAGLYDDAVRQGAALVLFPELSVSGYALDDLHQQDALLDAVLAALGRVIDATRGRPALLLCGAPLRFDGRLFNCAVAAADGRILGVVPKSYLPGYREFYEKRQFAAARDAVSDEVELLGERVPFGADLLFRDAARPDVCVHAEVCEDVWVPVPPSTWAALRGATILANLSASNITVGKASYRSQLAAGQSAKMLAAYLYSGAGCGESTTDLAWDGHALVYENGQALAESERFVDDSQLVLADVDVDRLVQERARMTSFIDCASDHAERVRALRVLEYTLPARTEAVHLRRHVDRLPYVPADPQRRDERCFEAYNIQVSGLVQRLRSSGLRKVVLGVSGGLDSTQALIVAVRAMDRLGLPRTNVLGYTLPGYATSAATLQSARRLMAALGVSAGEIDIRAACDRMFAEIDHPYARGEAVHDVTFENVQAGQRTSLLFRLANRHDAMVLGTGDLSELALGWCTYGVGDHMSHYNVNTSVPKTLVQHLIGWVAEQQETSVEAAEVLRAVLETEISPELVPGGDDGRPAQSTEAQIGPYELHDFTLYHVTRRGYAPAKVAYLALHAWAHDIPGAPPGGKYSADEVLRWQRVFLARFFGNSQWKRSCVPNGPKVGSGGSLSPRGDWRAPSDSSTAPWLTAHDAMVAWVTRSRG